MVGLQQKGVDLKKILSIFLGSMFLLDSISLAAAQNKKRNDEILLSINVGYNSAYREDSWVPVDLLVRNEQRDIDGVLEVRTYNSANQLQSPIYQIPADCPKDSTKRFRIMAYIDNASRVEAWVLENGRRAIDSPAFVQVRPIREKDLLALILDDDPLNYQFLNIVANNKNQGNRLFRHTISTQSMSALPDHAMAYDPFDFIVIGSIDPGRVAPEHRRLIGEYVESGGVLVVCTGLAGSQFKGTWVEELAGVKIGNLENVNETEIAERVFPRSLAANKPVDRDIVYTSLTPMDEKMLTYGTYETFATRRSLGAGFVCTFAVDTDSHAFQDSPQYQALWGQVITSREFDLPLNYDLFSNSATQLIPHLSGISIRPLSFVLAYLTLYIVVGILLNWFFWNRFKRREMAWVCLVFFSVGFSAYAYYSGTSGWAKASERQQIDVIRLRPDTTNADYFGLVGVLTPRTRTFDAVQTNSELLMKDFALISQQNMYGGQRTERTPFVHVQGDEPRMERLGIGASELRFAAMQGKIQFPGKVSGELVDDGSKISGSFVDETGLTFGAFMLVYEGAILPLQKIDGVWKVNQTHNAIRRQYQNSSRGGYSSQFFNYPGGPQPDTFSIIRRALFTEDVNYMIQDSYPPMLVAWGNEKTVDELKIDGKVVEKLGKTLLIAEVPLRLPNRRSYWEATSRKPLLVRDRQGNFSYSSYEKNDLDIWKAFDSRSGLNNDSEILFPLWMMRDVESSVEIKLSAKTYEDANKVELILGDKRDVDRQWHDEHFVEKKTRSMDDHTIVVMTYKVDNWRDYTAKFNERAMDLTVFAAPIDSENTEVIDVRTQYTLSAIGSGTRQNSVKGVWSEWQ